MEFYRFAPATRAAAPGRVVNTDFSDIPVINMKWRRRRRSAAQFDRFIDPYRYDVSISIRTVIVITLVIIFLRGDSCRHPAVDDGTIGFPYVPFLRDTINLEKH